MNSIICCLQSPCLPNKCFSLTNLFVMRVVYIPGLSALQVCLPYRSVCLKEVSAIESCLLCRAVCPTGMSTIQRCLTNKESALVRHRSNRCVCPAEMSREVSAQKGVCFREVSTSQRCLSNKVVCLKQLSTLQGCQPNRAPTLQRCMLNRVFAKQGFLP